MRHATPIVTKENTLPNTACSEPVITDKTARELLTIIARERGLTYVDHKDDRSTTFYVAGDVSLQVMWYQGSVENAFWRDERGMVMVSWHRERNAIQRYERVSTILSGVY